MACAYCLLLLFSEVSLNLKSNPVLNIQESVVVGNIKVLEAGNVK